MEKETLDKKSSICETPNLLTNADSSSDIFLSAGVDKGADSTYFVFSSSIISLWISYVEIYMFSYKNLLVPNDFFHNYDKVWIFAPVMLCNVILS